MPDVRQREKRHSDKHETYAGDNNRLNRERHPDSRDSHRHRSRSRERGSTSTRKHHHREREGKSDLKIKQEKVTPERRIKKEPISPEHSRGRRERHGNPDQYSGRWRERHESPDQDAGRERRIHRNNDDQQDRERNDRRRQHDKRRRQDNEDDSQYTFGKTEVKSESVKEEDKSKPDYGLSGNLADETNTYRGIVVKYNEPPEARKPKLKWRLYPFKGDEALPILHIHRQSGYLIGRDRKVADIPVDHPSCSKQHAVLQFRSVDYQRSDGSKGRHTRPYVIDLGSANGTFVNNKQIEAQRYLELFEKDTIKFGFSSRDYVILHDNVEVDENETDE